LKQLIGIITALRSNAIQSAPATRLIVKPQGAK